MNDTEPQPDFDVDEQDSAPDESEAFLEGVIAAIAVSPVDVPPAVWTAAFLDEDNDAATRAELEQAVASLRHILALEPDEYFPMFFDAEEGVQERGILFAVGFTAGMSMAQEAWMNCLRNEEHWDAFEPIAALAMQSADGPGHLQVPLEAQDPMSAEEIEECIESLPDCIVALYQMRLEAKAAHPLPTPGRNDPCPCGSGKKYKKCCGR